MAPLPRRAVPDRAVPVLASHNARRQYCCVDDTVAASGVGVLDKAVTILGALADRGPTSLAELVGATGLARQKTPVAWHFVDALPMTPSGKVKKFELVATANTVERLG